MKIRNSFQPSGFSLIETVIAIGVLAVLLSGFMIVFAPAASGIRSSLTTQDAARMVATVEQELVTLRGSAQTTNYTTGFNKAFDYIRNSSNPSSSSLALLVYKYRADLKTTRSDTTLAPLAKASTLIPGSDYIVQNMMRRLDDSNFIGGSSADLDAIEGTIYLVKCRQLVLDATGTMTVGTAGMIVNSEAPSTAVTDPKNYTSAVIPFVADFYALPGKTKAYFDSAFATTYKDSTKPTFSRNMAVRR